MDYKFNEENKKELEEEKDVKIEVNEPKIENRKKVLKKPNKGIVKLGSVLLGFSIAGIAFVGLNVFSFILVALYVVILVLGMFLTLFVFFREIAELLSKVSIAYEILDKVSVAIPYVFTVGLGFSIVSLLIFIFNKKFFGRKSKIIVSIIISVLYIIAISFNFFVLEGGFN